MHGNYTQETIDLAKKALSEGNSAMFKDISTATGLTYYDLQAPAKNLYPTITPLRNATPRVGRPSGYGTAAHWKVITGITGSGYDAMGWVPEGQRSGTMSYSAVDASAPYVTIGEEDSLTFEAESAAQGFEDVNATASLRLLQKAMRKEEPGILAGNRSLALGTPSTPTLSAKTDPSSLLPSATYSVIVVALTQEGYMNCKGAVANGVPTTKTVTGADGNTYILSGGSSNKSSAATQATVSGTSGLAASVSPVTGAVAYAWFVGTAGNETLQAITTINSVYINGALATGRQAATAITADNSRNASLAFDGYMTSAFSGGTVKTLGTGTVGTGSTLTATGSGSVVEIDGLLQSMWDNYRIGPTALYVSSQEQKNITNKVLSNSSGPLLRYDAPAAPGMPYGLVAGGQVEFYFNPFVGGGQSKPGGGQKIPVIAHPDIAPGTILAPCLQLPEWYQSNETPRVAEMICRRDYYRIDWPLRTRKREFGVYAEEVLAIYAPFCMGMITNIANG